MKKILFLNGFGQDLNSVPNFIKDIAYIPDYLKYNDIDLLFKDIQNFGTSYDLVIGWSLGAAIVLEGLEQNIFTTKSIILLAPFVTFIKDNKNPYGIEQIEFEDFRTNLKKDPKKTLKDFSALIALAKRPEKQILNILNNAEEIPANNLLYWLDKLENFSGLNLTANNKISVTIINGKNDRVVNYKQTQFFTKKFSKLKIISLENCAHAPHLHDENLFKKIVEDELSKNK